MLNGFKIRQKLLHQHVHEQSLEYKRKMKEDYDKRYKACSQRFKVGDLVLLKDTRVPKGSDRVLTRKPFANGLFIILEIVANDLIGPAYKIAHRDTGNMMTRLITHDRLKVYLDPENVQTAVLSQNRGQFADALRILDTSFVNGQRKYVVLFLDGKASWCQEFNVGMGLKLRVLLLFSAHYYSGAPRNNYFICTQVGRELWRKKNKYIHIY